MVVANHANIFYKFFKNLCTTVFDVYYKSVAKNVVKDLAKNLERFFMSKKMFLHTCWEEFLPKTSTFEVLLREFSSRPSTGFVKLLLPRLKA